jgi:putative nucleotidyltransferase with HDIG domain
MSKIKAHLIDLYGTSPYLRWMLLFGITLIFLILLYPNLIYTPLAYSIGDVAERDVKSPKDFLIEDPDATEINRRKALEEILAVYDLDSPLTPALCQGVGQAFEMVRRVIEFEKSTDNANTPPASGSPVLSHRKPNLHDRIWEHKPKFEETIGFSVSDSAYTILEKEEFSKTIADLIVRILSTVMENGVVSNKDILLKEADKGIILRDIATLSETFIIRLKSFYGLDQAKTMVRVVGAPLLNDVNYNLRNLVVEFVQNMVQPNITFNRKETEERKRKASDAIKPVLYKIKAGEMLLREGERVTPVHLVKIQALQAQENQHLKFSIGIGAAIMMVCLMVIVFILLQYHKQPINRKFNTNLLFLSCMLIVFFLVARLSVTITDTLVQKTSSGIPIFAILLGVPMASGAMTVCLFLGLSVASAFALIQSVATAFIFQNRFDIFVYFLLSGLSAAYCMLHCRERKVFIKAGIRIGLLNVVLAAAMTFLNANFYVVDLMWNSLFAFLGGVGSGIVAAGLAPLVEIIFEYTTDIKLLELSNLDCPILRKLMIEAPGTYHHSVVVGSMVEAAASEIGANPLLAKVGGYYHDIGKVRKPLYFIENQVNGKNKHDKLAPSMSRRILIAHVKDGVDIARELKLGQSIVDAIQQSHGTSLMRYFFDKAKQLKGDKEVHEDEYRYPGPKPQTREAGLVMLADIVEAASRTLDNPTPARIQGLVQNLINKVFSDGQLNNCELTLKDLNSIAKTFNKILNGIHHHRIEYSDTLVLVGGKAKDGHSDKQPAAPEKDSPKAPRTDGTGHLKRLGMS